MKSDYHLPVLLKESINGLKIDDEGIYVDATFGGGGHSLEILRSLSKKGRLISFDQDPDSINNSYEESNFYFVNENFKYMKRFLKNLGFSKVNGILADLGVSSFQINTPARGFSYRYDAALDMRMNKNNTLDAMKVINSYNHENLSKILFEYGDIKNSKKISEEIIKARTANKINTTFDFNKILKPLYPERYLNKNLSRIYQAIRIEVNKELDVLKSFLEQTSELLLPGGRLCVISYHSLEDRMVKRYITNGNFSTTVEKDLYGNFSVPFKKIGKMIQPSAVELKENIRSRSAKLRIAEKI
jgi:16S rRNA (cytosine1402-N4)-methyltransferase